MPTWVILVSWFSVHTEWSSEGSEFVRTYMQGCVCKMCLWPWSNEPIDASTFWCCYHNKCLKFRSLHTTTLYNSIGSAWSTNASAFWCCYHNKGLKFHSFHITTLYNSRKRLKHHYKSRKACNSLQCHTYASASHVVIIIRKCLEFMAVFTLQH